jgi:hypothetical protein
MDGGLPEAEMGGCMGVEGSGQRDQPVPQAVVGKGRAGLETPR